MNTREQLEELIGYMRIMTATPRYRKFCNYEDTLKQLLAERPYEPGDKIRVFEDENFGQPRTAEFYCVHPRDSGVVMARVLDRDRIQMWEYHHPIPKTRRLKPVPEEIINDARSAVEIGGDCASRLAQWLANPENWEE